MTKPKVEKEIKKRITKLDSIFSKYIRRRDADQSGHIHCITCGKMYKREDTNNVNNCHRIGRACRLYRRDEENCNAGCVSCNKYHQQEHIATFTIIMIKKHGLQRVEERQFQKNQINMRPKLWELQEKYSYFEEKINNVNI